MPTVGGCAGSAVGQGVRTGAGVLTDRAVGVKPYRVGKVPGTQAGRAPDALPGERRRRLDPEHAIPAVYAALAAAWILGSDALLALVAKGDAELFARLSTVKGWAFVLATAVLLHVLLRRALAHARALARGEEAQREEALRTRTLLLQVLDATPMPVYVTTREGRFGLVNRAWEEITRVPREEAIGRPVSEVLPEVSSALATADRVLERGEATRETETFTFQGERHVYDTLRFPLWGPDGEVFAVGGLSLDVTERTLAEARQRESREQLRALAARLQSAREEEKARIARDLHDELGQLLTGLKMDLRWLERRVGELPPSPETHALLDRAVAASALADQTSRSVQRLAAELRPGALDRLGLEAALRQEARRFAERTGIPCEVALGDAGTVLGPDGATTLYRIAQEAMTNVARHAGARRVRLALDRAGGDVVLRVEDDGRGLPSGAEVRPGALGLLGMKERAAMLGGEVRLEPRSGGGTVVLARLPAGAPGGSA